MFKRLTAQIWTISANYSLPTVKKCVTSKRTAIPPRYNSATSIHDKHVAFGINILEIKNNAPCRPPSVCLLYTFSVDCTWVPRLESLVMSKCCWEHLPSAHAGCRSVPKQAFHKHQLKTAPFGHRDFCSCIAGLPRGARLLLASVSVP